MIKLRYAILGSIIPMFVIFYYSNNIIDDLYNEINTLKEKDNG